MSHEFEDVKYSSTGEVKNFILVRIERYLFAIVDMLNQGRYDEALRMFRGLKALLPPEVKAPVMGYFEKLKVARGLVRLSVSGLTTGYKRLRARRYTAAQYSDLMYDAVELIQETMYDTNLREKRDTGLFIPSGDRKSGEGTHKGFPTELPSRVDEG